jgi:hypothetical protein
MEKIIKKGIKTLGGMRKDAIVYSKRTYNDFAKPIVKTISKRITKIDFNGIYKASVATAKMAISDARNLAMKSGKALQENSDRIARLSVVNFKRAQKFINKSAPVAKAAVLGFASANFSKAEKYLNKAYPKVQKFVKSNYPAVKSWVSVQLPKVEAFLAGQLSARVQRFAA